MKVWHGIYFDRWKRYDAIVTAETKNGALGLALMQYPDTGAKNWEFEKIDPSKEGVIEISSQGYHN